jgi:uncharacterized protein
MDLQTLSPLVDAVADPRFPLAFGIAAVAGLVRGFTGFGSALIYVPLMSVVYGPRIAVPTLAVIDFVCSLPFALRVLPDCNRREVVSVSITGTLALPCGVAALLLVDPLILRWLISILVLGAVATLVSGWRYHGRPTLAASLMVGALAGFGNGAVQIGVPPLLVFWLGGANKAATVRANIMVYFILQGALASLIYFFGGLFDAQSAILSVLLGLPFAAMIAAGALSFHRSSETLYRRMAYAIITFSALVGLPVLDPLR